MTHHPPRWEPRAGGSPAYGARIGTWDAVVEPAVGSLWRWHAARPGGEAVAGPRLLYSRELAQADAEDWLAGWGEGGR